MRVIIRFSLNGSNRRQTQLRQLIRNRLENQGIHWTGKTTSTYEGDVAETQIRNAVRDVWTAAATFPGNAHIDHFWMYADHGAPNLVAPATAEALGL